MAGKETEGPKSSVPPDTRGPPILENMFAPDIYADKAIFFSRRAGNISITLTAFRHDNSTQPDKVARVVIGRLVIPIVSAQAMVLDLNNYLVAQGFDPSKAEAAGAKIN